MKNSYSTEQKRLLKKIGSNIRRERQKKGLAQEEFAVKAKIDRTYVSSVERGERNVSVINLVKIANALKVNISVFFVSVNLENESDD